MRRLGLAFGFLALAVFAVGLNGCGSSEKADDAGSSQDNGNEHADHGPHDEHGDHEHGDHEHGDHEHGDHEHGDHEHGDHEHGDHDKHGATGQTDMEKMKVELAKLSPEDAASAEAQHFCPVSGKMLGTMGPPQKVDVNGQQVWICCADCEEELLAKPDEYLAKLNKE